MTGRRSGLVMAAVLALATPAGAHAATGAPTAASLGAVAAQDSGKTVAKTVTVKLKASWRVTRIRQLVIQDGAMTCKVTKLVKRRGRPATAATVRCTIAASRQSTKPALVIRVKNRKGAKVTIRVVFVTPAPAPGGAPGGTPPAPPAPQPTTSRGAIQRVNTSATGVGGDAEAGSQTWSPDGTQVAFVSNARNLVPGVTDGRLHVYLKTLASGAIRVIDAAQDGTVGNGDAGQTEQVGLAFRPDGTELLFISTSTNLQPGGNPYGSSLYSKSLTDNSVGLIGPGNGRPAWSPDGKKIAWDTDFGFAGANVEGGQDDLDGDTDVYMWTITTSGPYIVKRISSNSAGVGNSDPGAASGSNRARFSPDSGRIAFESRTNSLVPGDANTSVDVFVKDLGTNQTTRVSTDAGGAESFGNSEAPAWSPDGTRIAFHSKANTLVPGDINASEDVFIKNLATGAITLASTNAAGQPALFPNQRPSWSPDGVRLAFESDAVDLIPDDSNTRRDVFVKNLATGFVQLVSSTATGTAGDSSSTMFSGGPSSFSPDGTRLLFKSVAPNLAPGDGNAFGTDVFVKTIVP